jgi:hypothetical protein
VHILHGDGTRGWPELKIGGRLVIPIGSNPRAKNCEMGIPNAAILVSEALAVLVSYPPSSTEMIQKI